MEGRFVPLCSFIHDNPNTAPALSRKLTSFAKLRRWFVRRFFETVLVIDVYRAVYKQQSHKVKSQKCGVLGDSNKSLSRLWTNMRVKIVSSSYMTLWNILHPTRRYLTYLHIHAWPPCCGNTYAPLLQRHPQCQEEEEPAFVSTRLSDSNRANIAHVPYCRRYYRKAIDKNFYTFTWYCIVLFVCLEA